MLVLGLVLIVAAIAVGAGAVFDGSEAASVELFGATVDTTVAGVFFSGAATMLLFMVGVLMLVSSMGRSRRKRVERKEAKRRQRDSVQQLEEERAQLRAENERLAGQVGTSREPESAAAGRAAEDAPASERTDSRRDPATTSGDEQARPEPPASQDGRPMRESDGPAATGSHTRETVDAQGVDLRNRKPAAARNESPPT